MLLKGREFVGLTRKQPRFGPEGAVFACMRCSRDDQGQGYQGSYSKRYIRFRGFSGHFVLRTKASLAGMLAPRVAHSRPFSSAWISLIAVFISLPRKRAHGTPLAHHEEMNCRIVTALDCRNVSCGSKAEVQRGPRNVRSWG